MAWFKRRNKAAVTRQMELPNKRVSVEQDTSLLGSLTYLKDSYASLAHQLPFELYDYVELVALYNPDFSQAVNNIKNLANPGYKIIVNGGDEKEARERLTKKRRDIKPRVGGLDGIADALLSQGAVYGAMCGEWLLNEDFTDVVDFAIVNPKSIRFFWDEDEGDWHPYQKVSTQFGSDSKEIKQGCIRLNTNTFFYQAVLVSNNNPYGIPPLFAALENISIQREMINNLKSVTKKMGMLGILEIVINTLPMMPEESPQKYQERCKAFLGDYQSLIQDMVNQGGIVHFGDTEVKNLDISEQAQGAADIFNLNEEQVFSGLHSLPSVQGRSYSATETYAGVAYELLLRSIGDFSRAVKFIMEKGCWLMDTVWGTNVTEITFDFGENKALNLLQNAQAQAILLNNDMRLWHNKMLNQKQVAQRHGIDEVAEELDEPVEEPTKQQMIMVGELAKALDPNQEVRIDRKDYSDNVVEMFEPLEKLARTIVDDTKRKL